MTKPRVDLPSRAAARAPRPAKSRPRNGTPRRRSSATTIEAGRACARGRNRARLVSRPVGTSRMVRAPLHAVGCSADSTPSRAGRHGPAPLPAPVVRRAHRAQGGVRLTEARGGSASAARPHGTGTRASQTTQRLRAYTPAPAARPRAPRRRARDSRILNRRLPGVARHADCRSASFHLFSANRRAGSASYSAPATSIARRSSRRLQQRRRERVDRRARCRPGISEAEFVERSIDAVGPDLEAGVRVHDCAGDAHARCPSSRTLPIRAPRFTPSCSAIGAHVLVRPWSANDGAARRHADRLRSG